MKTSLLMILIFSLLSVYFWNKNFKTSPKQKLYILTYSSFAGLYSPGRALQKKFEQFCDCEITWFIAEDSTTLLQRLYLLSNIDVVIGWDQFSALDLKPSQWKDLRLFQKSFYKEIQKWRYNFLIPIDWAPIGFITKKSQTHIKTLKQLPQIEGQISFPEPKSSTLGLQFYYWIYEVFSGHIEHIENFLYQLKNTIYGPVFSWSLSYGFFQKGRVSMSLSYLTSLVYHIKEEQDLSYHFSYFQEGHPYQVEFASIPQKCQNCSLAFEFIQFLMTDSAQSIIRDKNYMFPVLRNLVPSPEVALKNPKMISYNRINEFLKKKDHLLQIWKDILY